MRNLLSAIRNSALIILLLLPTTLSAKVIGVVVAIKGNVFAMESGKAIQLSLGDEIKDFYDILTEDGSEITIRDYHDHEFHMTGGAHIKWLNKMIELKRGYVWVQSLNKSEKYVVQTSNSESSFYHGEFILSFDHVSGKSQILGLGGQITFSNLLEKHLHYKLISGQFSFIDDHYEEGIPRKPTQVGFSSFQKIRALFSDVKPLTKLNKNTIARNGHALPMTPPVASKKSHEAKRMPASVASGGEIIFVEKEPLPEKKPGNFNLNKFYKSKLVEIRKKRLAKDPREYRKKSGVPVRVFGSVPYAKNIEDKYSKKTVRKFISRRHNKARSRRAPASVMKSRVQPQTFQNGNTSDFEASYLDHYKKQMRHSTDTNGLIDELQNFKNNYQKSW
ncbi:MAG: hypothetical protein HOE90_12240 [Bacteriovoracaceae bacterium]|jgi:hypothetical protein|nr:hypothetical protein [Bacteriovoracaceae bacterium]